MPPPSPSSTSLPSTSLPSAEAPSAASPGSDAIDPSIVLADWLAAEEAVRARLDLSRPAGTAPAPRRTDLDGLALLQAMLAGDAPAPPICATLDFILIEATPGRAVFQGAPRVDFYNPLGTIHGGWIAAVLDSAVACAIQTELGIGRANTTVELKINMVRALTDRVERVRAEGLAIHVGSRIATAEGRLVGPDGRLYAHATTTCLILESRPDAAV